MDENGKIKIDAYNILGINKSGIDSLSDEDIEQEYYSKINNLSCWIKYLEQGKNANGEPLSIVEIAKQLNDLSNNFTLYCDAYEAIKTREKRENYDEENFSRKCESKSKDRENTLTLSGLTPYQILILNKTATNCTDRNISVRLIQFFKARLAEVSKDRNLNKGNLRPNDLEEKYLKDLFAKMSKYCWAYSQISTEKARKKYDDRYMETEEKFIKISSKAQNATVSNVKLHKLSTPIKGIEFEHDGKKAGICPVGYLEYDYYGDLTKKIGNDKIYCYVVAIQNKEEKPELHYAFADINWRSMKTKDEYRRKVMQRMSPIHMELAHKYTGDYVGNITDIDDPDTVFEIFGASEEVKAGACMELQRNIEKRPQEQNGVIYKGILATLGDIDDPSDPGNR